MSPQGPRHAHRIRIVPALHPSVIACALAFSALWTAPAGAQDTGDPYAVRSSHSGVYTDEQADKGLEVFNANCANCHNGQKPLSGTRFLGLWSDRSLYRLYEFMSTLMPYPAPGTLSPGEYSAVMAYVLRLNGYPAGTTPLSEVPFEIAQINLDPHPTP